MILFRSLTEKPETGPGGGCLIGDRSWNAQLYLRAGSEFTPDRQFRSDLFGAHCSLANCTSIKASANAPKE